MRLLPIPAQPRPPIVINVPVRTFNSIISLNSDYPELSNLLDFQDFPDLLDYSGFLVLPDSLDPSDLLERPDFLNLQDHPYLINLQEFSDLPDHLDLLDLLNLSNLFYLIELLELLDLLDLLALPDFLKTPYLLYPLDFPNFLDVQRPISSISVACLLGLANKDLRLFKLSPRDFYVTFRDF